MDGHSDVDMLERSELFRGASADLLRDVRRTGFPKQCAIGETLIRQGDPAVRIYAIMAGRLRVTQTTPDGQRIIIRYLGPGEVAGYAVLAGGETHPGAAVAVEKCHLFGWSAAAITSIMSRHSSVGMNAARLLGTRYLEVQVRLRELSTEKVERRLAHTILRLAKQAGRRTARGVEIAFPLSRQDLAEMSGTTLHTVSRTLSGWEGRGIVTCGRRNVVITDAELLVSVAEDFS